MTNEEAKSIISNIDKAYRTFSKEEIQALEKAITVLEQESCEDAISRAEVKRIIDFYKIQLDGIFKVNESIDNLPSVTPKPKTGHWIEHPHETGENWEYSKYECSECHVWEDDDSNYCPNCGAKMESEEQKC